MAAPKKTTPEASAAKERTIGELEEAIKALELENFTIREICAIEKNRRRKAELRMRLYLKELCNLQLGNMTTPEEIMPLITCADEEIPF